MKKFFLLIFFVALGFTSMFGAQTQVDFAQDNTNISMQANQTYVVTANFAYVYEQSDFSSQKLLKLTNKTNITLEFDVTKPKEYLDSTKNYVFFKVLNFDGKSGYIFSDLVTPKTSQITAIPNFNAKTNAQCTVYVKEDNVVKESNIKLAKNTKLFLYEGYNKQAEYIAVSYLYENEVEYGYLLRKDVSPNGINPLLITCATVVLAVLGVVFAWLFIKKKKSKK